MYSWRILLLDVGVDKQDRWRVRVRMSVPGRAEALPGTSDMGTHVQYVPTVRSSQAPRATVRSLGHQIVLEEDAGVAGPDVVAHLVPVQVSASHGAAHTAMAMMA